MPRPIALISAAVARGLDEDLAPLRAALEQRGHRVEVADWDDAGVDWARYALGVLRSTWDYSTRLGEFIAWLERAGALTRLCNPPALVRWNVDKHYLADLGGAGIPIVPSTFAEPAVAGRANPSADDTLRRFLLGLETAELVVKPAVGAGSRDAQRYGCEETGAIRDHMERLLRARRSVLLQPYLERVDEQGETALIHFEGRYSHAIRKGPLLRRGLAPTRALFAAEQISGREPQPAERALAERVLAAIPGGHPLYARVDLIAAADGTPRLLELELAEPSLFFAHSPDGAGALAEAIGRLLKNQ